LNHISLGKNDLCFTIGVCGGSGSGKTTFCRKLIEFLGRNNISFLKQDDYYKDLSHLTSEERAKVNFDHPNSLELSLLAKHLAMLEQKKQVMVPNYDFTTHCRTTAVETVSPKKIILVEGILLFSSPEVVNEINLKIFIDTKEQVRYERRLKRDTLERGRTHESVKTQFATTVQPMHNTFVEPSKVLANHVFSGEMPFEPHFSLIAELLIKNGVI
jgi:uridine kinase